MRRLLITLAAAAISLTTQAADPIRVAIDGATAVGFFPPFTQRELDNDDSSISEGTSHVAFALEDLAKCLAPRKLSASLQMTRTLVLNDGKASHTLRFPDEQGKSVGIVLAAPGKRPLVVYASAGPSSLLWLALDAAAIYFNAPKCMREVQ